MGRFYVSMCSFFTHIFVKACYFLLSYLSAPPCYIFGNFLSTSGSERARAHLVSSPAYVQVDYLHGTSALVTCIV